MPRRNSRMPTGSNWLLARRLGFTLIELLIVIAIIGVLMGLTIAAISAGLKSVNKTALNMDVSTMAQAVEAYKSKFGQYPPDGTSKSAFEAHFRAVFPNILASEFTALDAAAGSICPAGYMDPPEALVFCLGGFSKDATKPFTGTGGPLLANGTGWQYNPSRNEGFFEFNVDRLSLDSSSGATLSTDEALFGVSQPGGPAVDVLPVYVPRGRVMPLVYFAGNTYSFPVGSVPFYNYYSGSNIAGVARPYKSDNVNTGITYSATTADRFYKYAHDKYQIICAGLDDDFGGTATFWSNNTPRFFRYPSGTPLDIGLAANAQPGGANYQELTGGATAGQISQLDNIANFSDGSFEDKLP